MSTVHVEMHPDGETCVLVVVGDIDVASIAAVSHAGLTAVQASSTSALAVDLAGVPFIDSTGVGGLILIANAAEAAGTKFSVRNAPRQARRILALMGLYEKLGVVD